MRIVVTGQIGLDKKRYLEEVVAVSRAHGQALKVYHMGDMMYAEAGDVPPGRILDLPLSRLNSLRRAVFRDVLADLPHHKHTLINTHATFRWKHGLFSAFDFDQLMTFNADLYVCLVDNIETVHERMLRDHALEHSLKDLMVWREEEILATEILAKASVRVHAGSEHPKFFVLARGRPPASTAETLYRLIFRPDMKRVYPSFPMTHIYDLPDTLAEVNAFRTAIAGKFITFDPGDLDEKCIADAALHAAREGRVSLSINSQIDERRPDGHDKNSTTAASHPFQLKIADILAILPDIDGQIYARDFLLVRQADLVVSYIPQLPNGKPGLSSGVERELQHAHDHGRETYIVWRPSKDPSPFITQTANRVFRSVEEAFAHFDEKGYFYPHSLFVP